MHAAGMSLAPVPGELLALFSLILFASTRLTRDCSLHTNPPARRMRLCESGL